MRGRGPDSAVRPSAVAGMGLIEVVVAFAILSLALVALLRAFTGGLGGMAAAQRYELALQLAQSKIAEAADGERLAPGTQEGRFGPALHWRTEVRHYQTIPGARPLSPIQPYEVTVTVWAEDDTMAPVTLATLRLEPRAGP